jgi:hypothetical protein
MENLLSQILVDPSQAAGLPSGQDSDLLAGQTASDNAAPEQLMSASLAGDLGMQWNPTIESAKTGSETTGALDFEIPLDLSVTFDWNSFDTSSSVSASPESNEEMQRLLDQYTWNSIQV